MTTPIVVTATTQSRYMGYYSGSSGWSIMGCTQSDEVYTESGSYFGCKTINVGCTTAYAPSSSVLGMYYGCVGTDSSCVTQVMHYTWPDPPPGAGQKKKPVCVGKGWSVFDVYRVSPSTPTPTVSSSSRTAYALTPSPTLSSPTSSPTSRASTTTPIYTLPASPSQSVSPGVIAGATIAGVALLSVIAFMIWFFGFHRRKAAAQQQQQQQPLVQQYPPQTWQEPVAQQVYEVDGKGAPVSQGYGYGYAPLHQSQQSTWVHQNTYEVGELPGEQQSRK